jgi:hypothetical protein
MLLSLVLTGKMPRGAATFVPPSMPFIAPQIPKISIPRIPTIEEILGRRNKP